MFGKLIDKLKAKKKHLQSFTIDNNSVETKSIDEKNFKITISNENDIYKIEISDYISIGDYNQKMKSTEDYHVLKLLCNYVLWNSGKQKVNKGTYYVITIGNRIYNIFFTDEEIKIDERTKIELDQQTQKENITQERVITFNLNKNEYHYFSAKHESNGNTYYTKYYSKNRTYSLGILNLSSEEAYDEIKSVFYNLESIEGIENIFDIELLKSNILENPDKKHLQRKIIT